MTDGEHPEGHRPVEGRRDGTFDKVTIPQGGIRGVTAKVVRARQGGVGRAHAERIAITQGGIVLAEATEIDVTAGGVAGALAQELKLEGAVAHVVVAREKAEVGLIADGGDHRWSRSRCRWGRRNCPRVRHTTVCHRRPDFEHQAYSQRFRPLTLCLPLLPAGEYRSPHQRGPFLGSKPRPSGLAALLASLSAAFPPQSDGMRVLLRRHAPDSSTQEVLPENTTILGALLV